jgi:hypothetical protein
MDCATDRCDAKGMETTQMYGFGPAVEPVLVSVTGGISARVIR